MRNHFTGLLLVFLVYGFSAYAAYSHYTLSFANIHSPIFSASNIQISFSHLPKPQIKIGIDEIVLQGETWRNLFLFCNKFEMTNTLISCTDGRIRLPNKKSLPVLFHYLPTKKILEIDVKPAVNESWRFCLQWNEKTWHGFIKIKNGQVLHFASWLSNKKMMPVPSKGTINGQASLSGDVNGLVEISADLFLDQAAFSDSSGLHAGEHIDITISARASRVTSSKQLQWQSEVNWQRGEVFWQPLYLSGDGHRLSLSGTMDDGIIQLLNGSLLLTGVGELEFSGEIARSDMLLRDFELHADSLELSVLFDQYFKPFLGDTLFADLAVTGNGGIVWQYQNSVTEKLILDLDDVSVLDERKRFEFQRINAHIPWNRERATIADISILDGQVLQIPLGEVRVPLEINEFNLRVPQLVLPVLDGKLKLEQFNATYLKEGWQWQFRGELLPVSMTELTSALQIQKMHGTFSGVIPRVSYDDATITVDGTLYFSIFDGTMIVKNLTLLEPMGFAPHLKADVEMRNIDLGLLTRTFSFGKMQGRIDIDMHNLELANWRPIKFDASLTSSPGTYPRRISQAAIEHISALGGASAVAAIQRSFLRFFEEFKYFKIELRCSLRKNVCRMGGIEPQSGGYLIVEGGGIPAITVIGYNQNVSWPELINRLKRITQENSPVIR